MTKEVIKPKEKKEVLAKKDFIISQSGKKFVITKGKALPKDLPENYNQNLITEGVI